MKLAFIAAMAGSPWGGSEELWAATAEAALKQGHEVLISAYEWPTLPSAIIRLRDMGAQLRFHVRPQLGRRQRLIRLLRGKRPKPFQHVTDFQPDVICISQGGSWDMTALIRQAELQELTRHFQVPYIVLCHLAYDGHPVAPAWRETIVEIFNHAAHVCFVARANWKTAERQLAMKIGNGIVVRNPVNLKDTSAIPWPAGERASLCSVARFEVTFKGQDLLFEVLAAEKWRQRDWMLSLIGSGKDEEYLKRLAKYFQIDDRVRFVGQVNDIRAVWAREQLLVLPSHAEGTPLALVEAMLCGRPALVTDVGGNAEWIEEGQSGFVASAPTLPQLDAALERAWQSRERWQSMGQTARENAIARFEPDAGAKLLSMLTEAAK